jgi:hypothetical protein
MIATAAATIMRRGTALQTGMGRGIGIGIGTETGHTKGSQTATAGTGTDPAQVDARI